MPRKSEQWRQFKSNTNFKKTITTKPPIHDHDYSKIFTEEDGFTQKKSIRLKNKLAHIRKLIKSQKYKDARRELLRINHPIAEKWLEKLDEIAPEYKSLSPLEVKVNILDFFILLVAISGVIVMAVYDVITVDTAIALVFSFSLIFLLVFWLRSRN